MDTDMPYEWLTSPVKLHSSREHACKMTPEQCAFKYHRWVNWYAADLVYGHSAVYFFTAAIGVFVAAYALGRLLPRSARRSRAWLAAVAVIRSLSYPGVRVDWLRWNSPSLGVCLLLGTGFVFFTGISLGPKPYYWPNTPTVSYGDSPPLATRSGYLSLACLPFIFAFGAKANLVTAATGVAPEKLIVFHLFAAWGMFVLALMHTFPFVVYHMSAGDLVDNWNSSAMWLAGVIALIAQAWLTFMSLPFVRHRAYEFFKAFHFLMAAVFVVFLFIHVDYTLTSWDYIIAAGAIYVASLLFATVRTYFVHGLLRARIRLESEQTLKIAVPVAGTRLRWRPGQHLYLRFCTLGVHALTAHPFTICSAVRGDASELVFYAKPRGGLTRRLAALADKQPGMVVPVFVEGPYGGVPRRWDEGFDRAVVIAGGAGAGFSLGLIENWLQAHAGSAAAAASPSLLVVVSSRDPGFRRWFVGALHELADTFMGQGGRHLDDGGRRQRLQGITAVLHETGPAASPAGSRQDIHEAKLSAEGRDAQNEQGGKEDKEGRDGLQKGTCSPASQLAAIDIAYRTGQADLPALVHAAAASTPGGHLGVAVCGPSSMAHAVATACGAEQRRIVRGGAGAVEVWLHQEGFTN